MAKRDYHVIVYRILKYLYECFQTGERADLSLYGADAMGINNGYWTNVIESMSDDGLVKGVAAVPRLGGAPDIRVTNIKITSAGIEYLQDNSYMKKAAEFLKSIKETVPGL